MLNRKSVILGLLALGGFSISAAVWAAETRFPSLGEQRDAGKCVRVSTRTTSSATDQVQGQSGKPNPATSTAPAKAAD